jgi:hypothetical protein
MFHSVTVALALIVAALSWAAGDSTGKSWRDTWRVAATRVGGVPDAVRRELCPDRLIDYFSGHPAFAPEWFRVACAPLVVDDDRQRGLSLSLQERPWAGEQALQLRAHGRTSLSR